MSEQVMLQAIVKLDPRARHFICAACRSPTGASDFGLRLIADAGFWQSPIAGAGSELFGRQNNRRIHAAEQGHSLSSASWITRSTAPAFSAGADDGKNALRQSPAFPKHKAHCVSSAANRCFDLTQCLGTIPRGDRQELLTLGAAAVYLVKPTRRVAGSADHGRARKNIVDERSGLAAVKQAGAPVSSQTDNHSSSLY